MYSFVTQVSMLINQVLRYRRASLAVSWHSGATRIIVSTHRALSKVPSISCFFKSLDVRSNRVPRTTKVPKASTLSKTDKREQKGK
jgi:hypothetical protein